MYLFSKILTSKGNVMTLKELIEILKEFDENAEVFVTKELVDYDCFMEASVSTTVDLLECQEIWYNKKEKKVYLGYS